VPALDFAPDDVVGEVDGAIPPGLFVAGEFVAVGEVGVVGVAVVLVSDAAF
jgi:hypothetical protein